MSTTLPTPPIEPTQKRVRGVCDGRTIVDSTAVKLVWEHPYYPRYYFPAADVAEPCHNTSGIGELADHVAIDWAEMDAWFEEDEEVFVHARSPHTRIDALASSRHVVVEIDGAVVADSTRPVVLFETGLPARYYLPAADVRMDRLSPTDLHTDCPYKGTASYWSVGDHENIAWSYPEPVRESAPIRDLICFYNEHVGITVDGVAETKPTSPFS